MGWGISKSYSFKRTMKPEKMEFYMKASRYGTKAR
jgi:hypothetical protein